MTVGRDDDGMIASDGFEEGRSLGCDDGDNVGKGNGAKDGGREVEN